MRSIDNQTVLQARDAIDGRIHGAINARMERWILGRRFPTGVALVDSLIANTNRVYVRPADESYEYRVVWGNASGANVPVWIELLPDGSWQLKSVDYAASFNIGAKVDTAFMPPLAGDALKMVLPGYSFRPGRLRIDTTGGLIAYVEPFAYIYEGVEKYWEGGTVDLTAAVPGTAETWRWVKVGINPATNAIATANGSTQSIYVPLTDVQLSAIAMSGMIACGGVKLRNGQTKIGTSEGDFADAHSHFFTPHPLLQKTYIGAGAPTVNDDALDGFARFSRWLDTSTGTIYECVDPTAGSADWQVVTTTIDTFLSLTDTPSSYSGQGSKYVTVNSGATALEFTSLPASPTLKFSGWDHRVPPSSPSADDDEFSDGAVSGSWTEYDPDSIMTSSEGDIGLTLATLPTVGTRLTGLVKTKPSGAFTYDVYFRGVNHWAQAYAGFILLEDLAGGDCSTFGINTVAGTPTSYQISLSNWTNTSGSAGAGGGSVSTVLGATDLVLRYVYVSGNTYQYWYSFNGAHFTLLRQDTGTPPFTVAYVGVGIQAVTSTGNTARTSFGYFRYTNSALRPDQYIGGGKVSYYS